MNLTLAEASALVTQLRKSCDTNDVEVVVCPAFTALSSVSQLLKGSRLGLGAQDVFWEAQGAFTGEVSAPMLLDVGCSYVSSGIPSDGPCLGRPMNRSIVNWPSRSRID